MYVSHDEELGAHTQTHGRQHMYAGLVLMSKQCFHLLLLLVHTVVNKQPSAALNPVFYWWLSKLGLSIPWSWGVKAIMFFFVGKAKLYLLSGKYKNVQKGKVADTTPWCVFLCAGATRACTHSYICWINSPESAQTIGLIIENKAEGWGSRQEGLSKNE